MKALARVEFLVIPAAALLLYLNVRNGEFVFDDVKLVRDNPWVGSVRDNLSALDVFSDKWEDEQVRINYRPVRFLSYALDWHVTQWLWPNEPALRTTVFHIHNMLLHALNGLLLLLVLRKLLPDTGRVPLLLAFLWVIHPLQTESVAYISGRRDVLFTACYLGALALHLHGRREWWRIALAAALYVCGVLAKEMAVTLPAAIVLCDFQLRRRVDRRAIVAYAALGLIGVAYVIYKVGFKNPGWGAPYWGGTLATALLTEARAIVRYVYMSLVPFTLSVDWSYAAIRPSTSLVGPWTTIPALAGVLACACGAAYALLRRRGAWALGACLFLVTLAPVMQLVPHPERFAERYMYLPLAGLLLAVAWACNVLRPFVTGKVLAGIVLVLFAARTYVRTDDWLTSRALWESAVRVNPDCARAHSALAGELKSLQRWDSAELHLDCAIDILESATGLTPLEHGYAQKSRFMRGEVRSARGDALLSRVQELPEGDPERRRVAVDARELYVKAVADFDALLDVRDIDGKALGSGPGGVTINWNIGALRFKLQDYDRAEGAYRSVIAASDGTPSLAYQARQARFWLGMIEFARGKTTIGTRQILRAAQETENEGERLSYKSHLADILRKVGQWDQALAIYDEIRPGADDENRVTIDYYRAEIMDRVGRRSDAIFLLRDILERRPGLLPAELSLLDLELKEGRWKELKQRLGGLIREHGRLPVLAAYEQQLVLQESLAAQEPSRGAATLDAKALNRLGRENLEAQDWENAVAAFKDAYVAAEAAGQSDEALSALRQLAKSLRGAGRPNEAASVLRKACARAPADVRFVQDLGELFASSPDNPQYVQEAIVMYTRMASLASDGATKVMAFLALGELLERQGALEEAAEWYDRAAATGTVPVATHRRRGELWEAAGDPTKARAAFEAYLAAEEDPEKRRAVEEHMKVAPRKGAR